MNRLDSFTSGSNYNFADKLERPNYPRSVFDLSHDVIMSFPVGSIGALIPISVIETVPGDKFDIGLNHLLRVLPQVVPLYSNMKFYAHAFYSRVGDLWNSAQVYYTKGYNGDRVLKKPTINRNIFDYIGGQYTVRSDELFHYLYGLPIGLPYDAIDGKISALPYMMYLRIWRDYFMNKYFYTNNRHILPDDDTQFRLNTNGQLISDTGGTFMSELRIGMGVNSFLYRDFSDDRFIASMPSPQRGTPANISGLGAIEGWKIPYTNIAAPGQPAINVIDTNNFENPNTSPLNFLGYVGYKYEQRNDTNPNVAFPAFMDKNITQTGTMGERTRATRQA